MRVCASQVKNQIGRTAVLQLLQCLVQGLQIRRVRAAIRQLHIDVAGLFAKRKVLCTMQRQSEHRGVITKNMRRAVALVDIQVNHRHLQSPLLLPAPLGLHQPCSHRHVVENAKPAALVRIGMVGAASQIGGNTFFHGQSGRADGGAHRAPGPLNHALGPREADFALCCWRQTPLENRLYI